jgi:hypothetical protein
MRAIEVNTSAADTAVRTPAIVRSHAAAAA